MNEPSLESLESQQSDGAIFVPVSPRERTIASFPGLQQICRMAPCCRCKDSGLRCKSCACAKAGRPCENCAPGRVGRRSNCPLPATISSQPIVSSSLPVLVSFADAVSTPRKSIPVSRLSPAQDHGTGSPRSDADVCVRASSASDPVPTRSSDPHSPVSSLPASCPPRIDNGMTCHGVREAEELSNSEIRVGATGEPQIADLPPHGEEVKARRTSSCL